MGRVVLVAGGLVAVSETGSHEVNEALRRRSKALL